MAPMDISGEWGVSSNELHFPALHVAERRPFSDAADAMQCKGQASKKKEEKC